MRIKMRSNGSGKKKTDKKKKKNRETAEEGEGDSPSRCLREVVGDEVELDEAAVDLQRHIFANCRSIERTAEKKDRKKDRREASVWFCSSLALLQFLQIAKSTLYTNITIFCPLQKTKEQDKMPVLPLQEKKPVLKAFTEPPNCQLFLAFPKEERNSITMANS
jgi:hypothetical protein